MSLTERSVRSGAWSVGANAIKVLVLFGRSVLLARLLPVDTFGTYTMALSIVVLTGIIPSFGLGGAMLHRAPESADESASAATHFTLTLILTLAWAAAMVAASLVLAQGALQSTLIALTLIYAGLHLTDTPRFILTRRVDHRRLALIDIAETLLATAVALILALRGATVGALIATDFVALLLAVVGLYFIQPIWRPRLLWAQDMVTYYLRFGGRNFAAIGLGAAIDRVDDIWTGAVLGPTALGYYSRAYTFATYPRRVLAYPVHSVTSGTMAELKDDRSALSRTFFRTNALLVRSGFFAAGLLFLIAPEFVALLLGEKWLPMITPFRLLLIYALLDPVRATVSGLFVAVGRPEQLAWSRAVQLTVLIAGLIVLGQSWGVNGVAVAVDLMVVVGLVISLAQAKAHADFSVTRLFAAPTLAVMVGLAAALIAQQLLCGQTSGQTLCDNLWLTGLLKSGTFAAAFIMASLLIEREQIMETWQSVLRLLRPTEQPL